MAGLCGPKILLLWAGILSLTSCQNQANTITPRTPPLNAPTVKPNSSSAQTLNSAATEQPPASPRSPTPSAARGSGDPPSSLAPFTATPPVSTPTATEAASTTEAPPPPQCSYTLTPIKFGFRITIANSTTGSYTINIHEKGRPEARTENITVGVSGQTVSHDIKRLKPCTHYEHNVMLRVATVGEISCNATESETRTMTMDKSEIMSSSCTHGRVCYSSGWDISSALASNDQQAEPCKRGPEIFCIKPRFNDLCTDLNITFTLQPSQNCTGFSIRQRITADFLDPSEVVQKVSKTFPVKIEPVKPPKCHNLTVMYTCWENGKPDQPKNLSMLEPFTDYNCTGDIKDNNVTINQTTVIRVNIDCSLNITDTGTGTITNTSIDLWWNTDSENCRDILPKLPNLSYCCMCSATKSERSAAVCNRGAHGTATGSVSKWSNGGRCSIPELEPYTHYVCQVQPTYKDRNVGQVHVFKRRTAAGIPDHTNNVKVTNPEHNAIKVTCSSIERFNGREKMYIARLLDSSGTVIKNATRSQCNFEFKDLSYSTVYIVKVTTYNGKHESEAKREKATTQYNDKALIGFLVFLIILTSVALLLVVFKIYVLKRRTSHNMNEDMMLISPADEEESLLPVEPITAEVLLATYKRKLADEARLFLDEFQSIPRIFLRYSMKDARKTCNVPKNRYVDILPYDHNRVKLTTGNGEAGCDYINASFIDGYKESKKYIAAQGPKDETVSDFWRMIWEQQSSIIVMVTRCEEGNRVKCAQYWPSPEREAEIFEEFIVKLTSEDRCPDYTIRHLSLTNKREKNSEREVTHIQFMSWPDHGIPEEAHLLLKLRRRVNAFKNFFSGPIIVHCSAGVGRTGTYIGIDAMMEGLESEAQVDIYGYVVRLRRQRCLMVQVEAQYILIHQALLEHNQFGETEITLPELHGTLSMLRRKSSGEPTMMEDEFERLPTFRNWRTFNTGITDGNKKKNRSSAVIPYDYNRVMLRLGEGRSRDSDANEESEEGSSDEEDEEAIKYINASHINGYWGPRTFIAAQTPLADTRADFWSMVCQRRASAVVMLSDCSEDDKDSACVYWEEKATYGDFEVEVVSTETSPTFITRNMLLRHRQRKESRPVKHFQFLKWANREVPEKPQDLTDMIGAVKHSSGSGKSQSPPVVVHCDDGSSRSGIFCALWNVLDSAETEKLVDIFQVAKTLRKERQGMISSLEQYQFLYDALEGVYPVQNGEVKAGQASASFQVVNESTAAEKPASTTGDDQQEAASLEASGVKEGQTEQPEQASSETSPEDASNGPTITVEA